MHIICIILHPQRQLDSGSPTHTHVYTHTYIHLSFKSARHTEAHKLPKHEAQGARRRRTHHGCEARFYKNKFKKFFTFHKAYFITQVI